MRFFGNMYVVTVSLPGCGVINLIFIIKPFFPHAQNVKTKI